MRMPHQRVIASLREQGLVKTLVLVVNKSSRWLVNDNCITIENLYAQPVPESCEDSRADLTITQIDRNDERIENLCYVETHQARFDQGAVCFCALHSGRIVAAMWLTTDPYFDKDVRCNIALPENSSTAYLIYIRVSSTVREMGIASHLWSAANKYMRQRGIQWCVFKIDTFNKASINLHEKQGAQRTGTATYVVIGKLQLSFLPHRPFVHLSLRRRSSHTLVMPLPNAARAGR